jgi:hypothetical protein
MKKISLIINVVDFCLVSILCKEEVDLKWSGFITTNIINEKIYKLGTVSISNFLNLPLQDLLGASPSMTPIILFCIKKKIHFA